MISPTLLRETFLSLAMKRSSFAGIAIPIPTMERSLPADLLAGDLAADAAQRSQARHQPPGAPVQLLLGSVLAAIGFWISTWLGAQIPFAVFEPQVSAAFLAGLLLGRWSLVGFVAAHLALGTTGPWSEHLGHVVSYLPAGVVAMLGRKWIEAHSRDIVRYLRLILVAGAASLSAAGVGSALVFAGNFGPTLLYWSGSNFLSLVLLAPLVLVILFPTRLILCDRLSRSWHNVAIYGGLLATVALAPVMTSLFDSLSSIPLARYQWLTLLLLVPCVTAALMAGFRLAMLSASAVGIGYLLAEGLSGPGSHSEVVFIYSQPMIFAAASLVVAWRQQQILGLSSRLKESRHLLASQEQQIAQALSVALATRDTVTSEHLQRVGAFSAAVARRLGLQGRDLEVVELGAQLHDLGKLGIPERVLTKKGELAEEEMRLIQLHPEIGANILRGLDFLQEAVPLVYQHQERWDGSGYPRGLAGDEICLGARIIAVVDAFDAMVSDRPYRPARGLWTAIRELRIEAGHQFDPQVVKAFLATLAERPWPSEPRSSAQT